MIANINLNVNPKVHEKSIAFLRVDILIYSLLTSVNAGLLVCPGNIP